MAPQPGDLISGKYRIVRHIGDGGMGAVYEARHEVLETAVALKFLHAELTAQPGLVNRFMQEARVSATIRSPHVTRVSDVDRDEQGRAYFVMELLEGESLQARLDRDRVLPKDEALDIALQMLAGIEAAHARQIVHRDLKPDNVFITTTPGGPIVKLLDFGIAKLRRSVADGKHLTSPGALMGTPEYMAPEQAFAADQADERADIYSFGVIVYEMLTGRRPIEGSDLQVIVQHILSGKAVSLASLAPDLPVELVAAIDRALCPDAAQRQAQIGELRGPLVRAAGALSHAGYAAAFPGERSASAAPSRLPVSVGSAGIVPAGGAQGGSAELMRPSTVPATLPPAHPEEPPARIGTGKTLDDEGRPAGPDSGATAAMPVHPTGLSVAPAALHAAPMAVLQAPLMALPVQPMAMSVPPARVPGVPLSAAPRPAAAGTPRRPPALFWAVLALLVALASVAVWLAMNPSVLFDDGTPPWPEDLPRAPVAATAAADTSTPALEPAVPAGAASPRPRHSHRPSGGAEGAEPVPPAPPATAPAPPGFTLPSAMPPGLPTSFPNFFPSGLPPIPGLPPTAPPPSSPPPAN